jgi:threonine/homoserine/homoserine lactone efflux protein
MPHLGALALYVPLALAMAFTPGPATLFVLSRASAGGRKAGLLSAAGLLTGTLGLVALAAAGLTGVLDALPVVFEIVKSVGAAYLIYLGARVLIASQTFVARTIPVDDKRSGLRLYRDGVVTELLNPKAALFYASVLPQFIDGRRPDAPVQMFVLGIIFVAFGAISLGLIAISASTLSVYLQRSRAWRDVARWLSGAVLVGLGLRLAAGRIR